MGKSGLPFIKHFPVDEESDPNVRAMSAAEFGGYRHLCNVAWAQTPPCSIPDDDETLARWSTLGGEEWSRSKRRILAAWDLRKDDRWYLPQLERLWQEAREIGNKRTEAGRLGGRPKKQNESKPKANDNHLVSRVSEIQSSEKDKSHDDDARADKPPDKRSVLAVLMGFGFQSGWASQKARMFAHLTPERVEAVCQHVRDKYPGRTLSDYAALTYTALSESWVIQDPAAAQKAADAEEAAREAKMAELRAKREARRKTPA